MGGIFKIPWTEIVRISDDSIEENDIPTWCRHKAEV
jgi:hypothetical protein